MERDNHDGKWIIIFLVWILLLALGIWGASTLVKACVWFDFDKDKKQEKKMGV